MNSIIINGHDFSIKEYRGQRVVTLRDIDEVHERKPGTARKRFNDNRDHFIDGEDYYIIDQPSEFRTLGLERPQGGTPETITLITESGYLMLVKSFTDDLAWTVQRQLVKSYFRAKRVRAGADTLNGVANIMRAADIPMKDNNTPPEARLRQAQLLMREYGIPVIDDYAKPVESLQLKLDIALLPK